MKNPIVKLYFTKIFVHFVFVLSQEGPDPIRLGPNEYACPLCSKIMKKKNHMEDHIRIFVPFVIIYSPEKVVSIDTKRNAVGIMNLKYLEIRE